MGLPAAAAGQDGLCLRESAIHGLGCFTTKRIPEDAFIVEYTGERIPAEEAYRREADPARPGIYTFWIDDDWAIDALEQGNIARHINHCCTPNCYYRFDEGRVLIFAGRDIAAEEELTIDYCFSADGEKVPCACGSPDCRGMINSCE
jgi:SET domain-containing protein